MFCLQIQARGGRTTNEEFEYSTKGSFVHYEQCQVHCVASKKIRKTEHKNRKMLRCPQKSQTLNWFVRRENFEKSSPNHLS